MMLKIRNLTYFILFLLFDLSSAVDLTCPGPVSVDQKVGKFPSDGVSVFPANYACNVQFTIPDGWVVKYSVQVNPNSIDDKLTIQNSAGYSEIFLTAGEFVYYAPATSSNLTISTKTATSSFYFSWQFVDVTTFNRIQLQTGQIMKMDLTPLYFYQFVSPDSPVTFHVANLNQKIDLNLPSIYVFDGEDLKTAKFLGNLFQFTSSRQKSTGNSLILVNFYAYNSASYGFANNYNDISKYQEYNFIVLSKTGDLEGYLDASGAESAVTFFCMDSQEVYISDMTIVGVQGQTVSFQPMSPSDRKGVLLGYDASTQKWTQLPQQIPANIFTMIVSKCSVSIRLSSGPSTFWTISYPGRSGVVFSPNLWNPRESPKYDANFSSPQTLSYYFNIESLVISEQNVGLHVQIDAHSTTFASSTQNQARLANGTFMDVSYNGTNPGSSFILTFEMQDPNPGTTVSTRTPSVSTTMSHVETTTKASLGGAFMMSIAVILMTLF